MTGSLRLITFDLDNTLWSTPEVITLAERASSDYLSAKYPAHAPALSCEALRAARAEILDKDPARLSDLTALRRDSVTTILIACGLSRREACEQSDLAFEVFHDARNRVTLFDGALEMLRTLGDRYILGALSNGNADLHKIGIADLFAFHHSSETIGTRKPAPDMFHAALASAGVDAAEALHVGDHPLEDVHAAREAGLRAVWINFDGAAWPLDLPHPEFTVASLPELVRLIARLDLQTPVPTAPDR